MRLVIALLLACMPLDAWACSCVRPTLQRVVLPPDGTVDFPRDGRLRVFLTGGFPAELRARLGEEYRLIGPAGPVALRSSVVRTRLDLVPTEPLAANTAYTLEAAFAYAGGRRLTDTDRLRAAMTANSGHVRLWYPVLGFTTGAGLGGPPGLAPITGDARVSFRSGGGDCGPGTALVVEWSAKGVPGAFDVLELEVEGHGVLASQPAALAGRRSMYVSDLLCNPDKYSLGTKAPFKARISAVSATGERSATGAWVTSDARGPSLFRRPTRPRVARPWAEADAALSRWFKGPIEPGRPPPGDGPAACGHGFETVWRQTAAAEGTPRAYEVWHSVGATADGAWALVRDAERPRLALVGAAGVSEVVLPAGDPVAAARVGDDFAVLYRTAADKESHLDLVGISAKGAERWRTRISAGQMNWHASLAVCGERVGVAWSRVAQAQYGQSRLNWSVLDDAGAVVGRSVGAEGEPLGFGGQIGLGCGMGGFVLLTAGPDRGRGGALGLRISLAGVAARFETTAALGGDTFQLAPLGDGAAVAIGSARGVEVVRLDRQGAMVGEPISVARGRDQRKPSVAAFDGLVAIGWEAYPGNRAYATAVDAQGRVAETLALGDGADAGTVRVAAGPSGVFAALRRGAGLAIEHLRCRAAPAPGAPSRLPPGG